jgi:hypothetical protein
MGLMPTLISYYRRRGVIGVENHNLRKMKDLKEETMERKTPTKMT